MQSPTACTRRRGRRRLWRGFTTNTFQGWRHDNFSLRYTLSIPKEEIWQSLFYQDKNGFIDVMRHAIALNGSFFNTHRMLEQYVVKAYF